MAAREIPHNLAERPLRFPGQVRLSGYGRERAELLRLLLPQHRAWMVALEGVGGVGKTTLALDVAWAVIERPDQYPFDAVIWLSTRAPALVPIGYTPTLPRMARVPHTLAAICRALADLLGLPDLTTVAPCGAPDHLVAILRAVLREHPVLLVLDDIDAIDPADEQSIHTLLRLLPAPSKAIVTAREDHDFLDPFRLAGLDEAAMEAFVEQASAAANLQLDAEQRGIVCGWAMGLPFGACVAIHRMRQLGVELALADLAREPVALVRPVFGRRLHQLRAECPESYEALLALARDGMADGLTKSEAYEALDADPELGTLLLTPLLQGNLIISQRGTPYYTMAPVVRWYLRRHLAARSMRRTGKPAPSS